jgi:hypothetical protein
MLVTDFVIATSIPFVIQCLLWTWIFDGREGAQIGGFTQRELLFYYAFALAFGRFNNGYDVIRSVAHSIDAGTLEVFITKPIAVPLRQFFIFVGESALYIVPIIAIVVVAAGSGDELAWGGLTIAGMLLALVLSQIHHLPVFVEFGAVRVLDQEIGFSVRLADQLDGRARRHPFARGSVGRVGCSPDEEQPALPSGWGACRTGRYADGQQDDRDHRDAVRLDCRVCGTGDCSVATGHGKTSKYGRLRCTPSPRSSSLRSGSRWRDASMWAPNSACHCFISLSRLLSFRSYLIFPTAWADGTKARCT